MAMLNNQRVYFKIFTRVDVKISVQRKGHLFFSLSQFFELVLSNSSQNEAGFSKKWEPWSHRPLNIPWGHQLPGHQGGIPTIKISNVDVANTQYIVDSIINRHFLGLLHVSFCEREVWMFHIYIYSSLPAFLWYTHKKKQQTTWNLQKMGLEDYLPIASK